ncbi:MAG: hypothetical protein M5R36_24015 [Deltaproteobacteria bacterium]|nr:hypothetical protein [Deltaproteobacteria bacterium]
MPLVGALVDAEVTSAGAVVVTQADAPRAGRDRNVELRKQGHVEDVPRVEDRREIADEQRETLGRAGPVGVLVDDEIDVARGLAAGENGDPDFGQVGRVLVGRQARDRVEHPAGERDGIFKTVVVLFHGAVRRRGAVAFEQHVVDRPPQIPEASRLVPPTQPHLRLAIRDSGDIEIDVLVEMRLVDVVENGGRAGIFHVERRLVAGAGQILKIAAETDLHVGEHGQVDVIRNQFRVRGRVGNRKPRLKYA